MNQKLKLLTAFLCGAVFFNGVSYAASNLTATVTNLKIVVNGQEKSLSEKPVVINNKTYLPVRDIGTITGYQVNYQKGVVSLDGVNTTDQNNSSASTSASTDTTTETTTDKPRFDFKKLPITVMHDDVSVTVNSVSQGEYSTDFNVTIVNNSSEDLQVQYDLNALGANYDVPGKEYKTYGTIGEKNEFYSPIKAGTTVTGTIRKSKVDAGTENLLFHLLINGKGFSFYIDTKGMF